ncbi:RNA-directed DNA polymerase, eukaryota [Tanacetum coccineum]
MVEQAWSSFTHNDSNGLIRFKKKLQDLKKIIREWVRQSNDSKVGVKKAILVDLADIDKSLDSGIISDELLAKRSDLNRKLFELNQLDTKDAAQKAKIKWAIEGDENSKFFHGIINKRRSQLAIRGIFDNGDWCTDPSLVKEAFRGHFASRFTQPCSSRFKINFTFPNRLSADQIGELDKDVTPDEIRMAVWECGECKSPGPDGYTFEFFRRYWSFVGPDFCSAWICGIFSSNMASILVNGSPTNEFPICCGLKQGGPLALFLFILVMESLHLSISRAIIDGFFNGLHINASMSLSHLFYADDAVFLGEWSDENLDNLLKILRCFHLASGLRINIAKSHVLGVGVPLEIVHQGASRIGCEVMKTPFKYLGIMVGDHMSRCSAWSNSIQKVRTRLSKWKVKTLSIGGRLTLLKSVLGAVPIYNLSIYKAPKRVLHDMEMLRSKFFNGGDSQDSRISWVAWERVLSSKKNEGLWVSSFFALNRALLLKWLWRFLSQDNSLWSYVIRAIHGPRLELHSYSTQSVWGVILREVQLLASEGFDFLSRCKIRVGDGDYDKQIRDGRAKVGDSSLLILFRGKFRDEVETSQWAELLSLTGSVSLSSSSDRWICDCNGEGVFHVKDIRSALDDHFLPSADVATRWVKFVPIKVNIFAWRARLNRLPTRGNLLARGVSLDSSLCPICNELQEDSDHLFFSCDLGKCTLQNICRIGGWNLQWKRFLHLLDWYSWFLVLSGCRSSSRPFWKAFSILHGGISGHSETV